MDGKSTDRKANKSATTKRRILETAIQCFLRDGYSKASLERVAKEAGTTKPTVYSHFGSKQGLFQAVLESSIEKRKSEVAKILIPTDCPRDDLQKFANFFLSIVLSEESQRWDRMAAVESIAHPEVGQIFYKNGPAKVLAMLTEYFTRQTEKNILAVPVPEKAAEQMIGLLICTDLLKVQIGQKPPSKEKRAERSKEAVEILLKFYGV